MRIGFLGGHGENEYADNLINHLNSFGHVEKLPKYKDFIFLIFHLITKRYDCIFVCWIENVFVQRGNMRIFSGLIYFFLLKFLLDFSGKKIVYIKHNKWHHNINKLDINISKKIQNFVLNRFDFKVSHKIKDGFLFLLHPLYGGEIDFNFVEEIKCKHSIKKYFLIFGRIEKYKNILEFICGYNADVSVVIVGKCIDEDYLNSCFDAARKKDIHIFPGHLPAESLNGLIAASEGVIINHADESPIISGSFVHAISLGAVVYIESDTSLFKSYGNYSKIIDISKFPNDSFSSCQDLINNSHTEYLHKEYNQIIKAQLRDILNA